MHTATLLLIMLSAGLASQWLAWRIRIPAIVILIATGLILGPVTGVITLAMSQTELTELIGMGVAIILFEGGMDLKLGEFRRVGHGIGRLTIVAPPLAWVFGAAAAHYVAGLSWPVSWASDGGGGGKSMAFLSVVRLFSMMSLLLAGRLAVASTVLIVSRESSMTLLLLQHPPRNSGSAGSKPES